MRAVFNLTSLVAVLGLLLFPMRAAAAPELRVNWFDKSESSLKVSVTGTSDILRECIESGLEIRYKYYAKLCRKRNYWADSCSAEQIETHAIQFDPISENYRVTVDIRDDNREPLVNHRPTLEEALTALSSIDAMPLESFDNFKDGVIGSGREFISVRVVSDCKGEYNKALARISYFLTFGLMRISGFSTGWVDFNLAKSR